jgi:ketosteroid isomerase-like protein
MSRENVELMERAYAAITRGDLDAFLALSHPEIEFRSLIAEAGGGGFSGHEGVRDWWATVIESLDVRPNPEEIESFRDRGITRLALAGTIDGVEVPQKMWMAWRLRDGLLVWWTTYRTEVEALEAVGLAEKG